MSGSGGNDSSQDSQGDDCSEDPAQNPPDCMHSEKRLGETKLFKSRSYILLKRRGKNGRKRKSSYQNG